MAAALNQVQVWLGMSAALLVWWQWAAQQLPWGTVAYALAFSALCQPWFFGLGIWLLRFRSPIPIFLGCLVSFQVFAFTLVFLEQSRWTSAWPIAASWRRFSPSSALFSPGTPIADGWWPISIEGNMNENNNLQALLSRDHPAGAANARKQANPYAQVTLSYFRRPFSSCKLGLLFVGAILLFVLMVFGLARIGRGQNFAVQQLLPLTFLFLFLVVHAKDQFADSRARLTPGFRRAHATIAAAAAAVCGILLPAVVAWLLGWHSIGFVAIAVVLLATILWMLLTMSGWVCLPALAAWCWLPTEAGRECVQQLVSGRYEPQAAALLALAWPYSSLEESGSSGSTRTCGHIGGSSGNCGAAGPKRSAAYHRRPDYQGSEGLDRGAGNENRGSPRPAGLRLAVVEGALVASGRGRRLAALALDPCSGARRSLHVLVAAGEDGAIAGRWRDRPDVLRPDPHAVAGPGRRGCSTGWDAGI